MKIRNEWEKLKEMKTLRELIMYIPRHRVEQVSLVLLIYLCAVPLVLAPLFVPMELMGSKIPYSGEWYYKIMPVGLLGLLVGIYGVSRSLYERKDNKQTWKNWMLQHGLFLFLGLMLLWSAVSALLANDHSITLWGTQYRRDGLVMYLVYAGCLSMAVQLRNSKYVRILLEIFVGSSAVLAFIQTIDIEAVNEFMNIRIGCGPFFQINHYGYYLCMTYLGLLVLWVTQKSKMKAWQMVIRIAEAALICNAVVLCKSLGSLIAELVGLAAVFVFVLWKDRSKLFRVSMAMGSTAAVLVFMNTGDWNLLQEFQLLFSDAEKVIEGDDFESAGTGRGILWKLGIQFASQKPVFGYGPDNLGFLYEQYHVGTDRPHNELIQFAASLGIPAMVYYVAGLAFHLRDFIAGFKRIDLFTIGLYIMVGGYLVSSLFGNTMFYTTPYFYMILGLSYAQIRRETSLFKGMERVNKER